MASFLFINESNYIESDEFADVIGGHSLTAEEECLPELQPVHRDGQRNLLPRVRNVSAVTHDHRTEKLANESHGFEHPRRKGLKNLLPS